MVVLQFSLMLVRGAFEKYVTTAVEHHCEQFSPLGRSYILYEVPIDRRPVELLFHFLFIYFRFGIIISYITLANTCQVPLCTFRLFQRVKASSYYAGFSLV